MDSKQQHPKPSSTLVCVYNDTAIRKGKVTFCLDLIDMHTQTYTSVKDTHSSIFGDIVPVHNWLGHTLQSKVPLFLTHCIADLAPCGHRGLSPSSLDDGKHYLLLPKY